MHWGQETRRLYWRPSLRQRLGNGHALFLLKHRVLALVLSHLNGTGWNFAHTYCCTEYTCGL